ncbi:MAG: hypothetical protein NTU53_22100 [Planctomycetota bacterium]|nr:hypothetical protein [Planctomycetota bacterium]
MILSQVAHTNPDISPRVDRLLIWPVSAPILTSCGATCAETNLRLRDSSRRLWFLPRPWRSDYAQKLPTA